jgi:tetratricopeptide (TPR) repeat protein
MPNASDLYEEILNSSPSLDTALLILSRLKEEGHYSDVIKGCLDALGLYPGSIPLRRLLAEAYIAEGFLTLAEEEFEMIISEINDLMPLFKSLGDIYIKNGKLDEASRILDLYLKHFPDDEEAYNLANKSREEKDSDFFDEDFELEHHADGYKPIHDEGEETFDEQNVELDPSTVELFKLNDSQIEADRIKTDLSVSNSERSELDEDEFSELATPTLAEIYYNQGQIKNAINTYERVILKDPDDRTSIERLAEIKTFRDVQPDKDDSHDLEERKKKMVSVLEGWLSRIKDKDTTG